LEREIARYVDDSPMPEVSRGERERGYVLFARSWMEMTFPNSIPRKDELTGTLESFTALGEYEPTTFCVRALKDLKNARVAVSDLTDGDGGVISRENIDVRVVRCLVPGGRFGGMLIPALLEKRASVDVDRDTTGQFWLTVWVPSDARPGHYKCQIKFSPENARPGTLEWRLRVLPIKLEEPRGVSFAIKEGHSLPPYPILREHFEEMRRHGMNTFEYRGLLGAKMGLKDGKVVVTLNGTSALEMVMKAYMEAGYTEPVHWNMGSEQGRMADIRQWCLERGPLESEAFADCYRQVIGAVLEEGRRRGWPEIIFGPEDEPTEWCQRMEATVRCLKLLKGLGVRTGENGVGGRPLRPFRGRQWTSDELLEELYPLLDILLFHDGPFLRRGVYDMGAWEGFLRRAKGDGKEVRIYNVDNTPYHAEAKRFAYGLLLWYAKADGAHLWQYGGMGGGLNSFNLTPEEEAGGLYIFWEGMREGVKDYKYLYTLHALIAKAKKSGKSVVREMADKAEGEVNAMLAKIDVSKFVPRPVQGRWTGGGPVAGEPGEKTVSGVYKMRNGLEFSDYERIRWTAAQGIMRLQDMI